MVEQLIGVAEHMHRTTDNDSMSILKHTVKAGKVSQFDIQDMHVMYIS